MKNNHRPLRRVFLIVIPALLLLAAFQLSRVSANWRYVVPDSAGTVLYATSFEGDSATDEWDTFEGRMAAQIVDGKLRLDIDVSDAAAYSPLRWTMRDFDVTVNAAAVDGPESNGFGIIFRLTDRSNYYYFLIGSDGTYSLHRVLDNQDQLLTDWTVSSAIKSGIGATNTLRVTGKGSDYQFYINGELTPLCLPKNLEGKSTYNTDGSCMGDVTNTLSDATITEGKIGLMAQTIPGSEGAVVVDFDQVVIYSPS